MAKILVTGGAGFIGSNLVDELVKRGHGVVVIDNLSTGKKNYLNSSAKFYQVDICSDKIGKIFKDENFDYVFHLAAQIDVRKSVDDPVFDNKINALGSLKIFEQCQAGVVKKVIFVSTGGGLYGDTEVPATEENLIEPLSPYAIHKYTAERYLELQRVLHDLDYVILRPANVYGPRQYRGGEGAVIGVFTNNVVNQKSSIVYGDGTKTRDFLYVEDAVKAFIKALESKHYGVFNIGTGRETSINQLIETIEKVTGTEFIYNRAEDKPGEVWCSVLNCQKAEKLLNWRSTTELDIGIEKTLAWLRK